MICYTLITKCNWECDYCVANTRRSQNNLPQNKNPDIYKIMEDLREYKNEDIVLSGGEPGFFKINELNDIICTIDESNTIYINTNGMLLDKMFKYFGNISFDVLGLENKPILLGLLRPLTIRWHLFEDANIILDYKKAYSKIEKTLLGLYFLPKRINIEFQIILTEACIESNLLYTEEFIAFIHLCKALNQNFRLVVTPDLRLKNSKKALNLIKEFKQLYYINSQYLMVSDKPYENSGIIDIEETNIGFNEILYFEKKQKINFFGDERRFDGTN